MKKKIKLTLCIVHRGDRVLLGMKKRGFGAGRYNGFGGKVLEGETIEEAAFREVSEEAGITIASPEKLGILEFSFEHDPSEVLEVHIFKVREFSGNPRETEEMKPEWFGVEEIPFGTMWPDDRYWIPLFLEDRSFRGRFHFGKNDAILEQELQEVNVP